MQPDSLDSVKGAVQYVCTPAIAAIIRSMLLNFRFEPRVEMVEAGEAGEA